MEGIGLTPGDSFIFYHTNMEATLTCKDIACDNLETLKEFVDENECDVFGGLILSSNFCGMKYFGAENVDVMRFIDNFPGTSSSSSFFELPFGRNSKMSEREWLTVERKNYWRREEMITVWGRRKSYGGGEEERMVHGLKLGGELGKFQKCGEGECCA
ncbi:hypothetical protein K1719_003727 [Acacia pycnantha]|nr:hypothetical protein K1719_003727 [Acacia pycnantha]